MARHRPRPRIARPPRLRALKPQIERPVHTTVAPHPRAISDHILETPQSSLLDLVDELLNKGVMANGDLTLGVAGIDLIYLRLSSLLCAADRVLPADPDRPTKRRRR